MTWDPRLFTFIGVAALLTVLPGADMALVTRNVLAVGRRQTMGTITGISCGCVLHATASALGLSVILATSATAFNVVKSIGAAYLVWIGIQSFRAASAAGRAPLSVEKIDKIQKIEKAKNTMEAEQAGLPALRPGMLSSPFVQGFLTNILNPKVAVFYLTFLPQFIAPGQPVLRRSLLLASVHIAMGFAWLTAYAWFVDRLGSVLSRPRVKARLERATGALLVALGARLAWEHR